MSRAALALGLALAAGAGLAAPCPARASVVVAKTIEEMSLEAAAVVQARVLARSSAWDEAHRRIHTYVELRVLETWAGSAPETLVVRTLGGEVAGVGMRVSGTATFADGEEVVLFLRADPVDARQFQVIGMAQGKLGVVRGAEGPLAVPSVEGLALAAPDATGALRFDAGARVEPVPLAALRERVTTARATAEPPKTSDPSAPPRAPVPAPTAPRAEPRAAPRD